MCFLQLIESAVHLTPHLWNSGRQEVWIRSRLVSESSPHDEVAKT